MENIKGKTITVTKKTDCVFDGNHPNGIVEGYSKTGKALNDLTVGSSLVITYNDGYGMFMTSTVMKINDDMTFETENSVYVINSIAE